MKNVIKKISAVAMAFTLLGTGIAATKTIAPEKDNTLTAQAYMPPQYCSHNSGIHYYYYYSYRSGNKGYDVYLKCCNSCGTPLGYYVDEYWYV